MPERPPPKAKPEDTASPKEGLSPPTHRENAGRGGLALAAGKIFFLVTGLVQQVALKAVLGLSGYGALSTAQSVASICYNPIIQSGIQGVSRSIAVAEEAESMQIQRRLLKLHAFGAVLSGLVFFASAGTIASVLGAPHIAGGLKLFSVIMLLYGLYAPLVGILNGRRRFFAQAGLDMLSATLRTTGLVFGAYFATKFLTGGGDATATTVQVEGAIIGFCVAALLWVSFAFRIAGLGQAGGRHPQVTRYLKMVLPILGGQILLNLLFQADALLLRKFASDAALSTGLAVETADNYVGAYRASQLFCFLPFQLLTSLTFVLFPLLARAQSQDKTAEVSQLVARGLRLATVIAGLIVSALVTVPDGLLLVVFGSEASELGSASMRILAIGMAFFALLGVITSAMNSLGAERASLALFGGAAVLVGSLCLLFTQGIPLGAELLSRVALATTLAMLATTGVAALILGRLTGGTLSLLTFVRTIGSVIIVGWGLSRFFLPFENASRIQAGIPTLVGAGAAVLCFVLLLIVSGELGKKDLNDLKNLLGRK
jgi:stage V sporulation protein B